MKIKLNKDRLKKTGDGFIRWLPLYSVVITIVIFLILSYFAVVPRVDDQVRSDGSAQVQALDIQFNTKLLKELANSTQSAQVNETGGRDPFSPF